MNEWMSEWIIKLLISLASRLRHQNIQTYRQTKKQTYKQSDRYEDRVSPLSSYSLPALPFCTRFILTSYLVSLLFHLFSFTFIPSPRPSSLHYTFARTTLHHPSLPLADLPFYFCTHSHNINTIVLEHSITTHTGDQHSSKLSLSIIK
jgi:hypothetical protein